VEVFSGAGEGPVLCHRVEYLKSAICHDNDKYRLFSELKHSLSIFGRPRKSRLQSPTEGSAGVIPHPAQNGARTCLQQPCGRFAQDHRGANSFML
jgi:hypothetical protein